MNSVEAFPLLTVKKESQWKRRCIDSLLALGGILLLTGIISFFHLYQLILDTLLLYLPVILLLASKRGLYAALLATFLAFFVFDFLYVAPLYSFIITKFTDVIALVVFLITAVTTGQLASALRKRAYDASRRERETRILYDVVHATNREEDVEQQLHSFAGSVVEVFSQWGIRDCRVFLPASCDRHMLEENATLTADEEEVVLQVLTEARIVDIHDTSSFHTVAAQRYMGKWRTKKREYCRRYVPLITQQRVVGVLRLLIEDNLQPLLTRHSLAIEQEQFDSQSVFFSTLLEQAVSIIERDRLQRESIQNKVLQQTDTLRSALLSSVSHDLRTPLTTIKSAASSLLQRDVELDQQVRDNFALAIERESDRLNRLVGNLLDMSRIEGGALHPKKVWYPLDEIIYGVLERMQSLLQGRVVRKHIPEQLPPVEIDYVQIEQVITNLLENALRYTPLDSPLDISVHIQEWQQEVRVADRGPGVPLAERERIFDKFYRVHREPNAADHDKGSGLGLAVSKGILEAHNGRIWVEAREGGGAIFCFVLPMGNVEREQV